MIPDTTRYSPGRFLWVQNRAKGCTQKGNGWLHLNVEMKPIFPAWKFFLFGFEIRLFLCRFKTIFSRKRRENDGFIPFLFMQSQNIVFNSLYLPI